MPTAVDYDWAQPACAKHQAPTTRRPSLVQRLFQSDQGQTPSPSKSLIPSTPSTLSRKSKAAKPLAIFSALSALREGKLPTNDQLESLLDHLLHAESINKRRHLLSEDGERVWTGFETLCQDLVEVLESKNDDMIVQEFIFNARKAAKHRVEQRQQNLGEALANGGAKEEAKAEGYLDQITNIGRLVLTDEEFRRILFSLNNLLQDVVSGIRDVGAGMGAEEQESQYGTTERGEPEETLKPGREESTTVERASEVPRGQEQETSAGEEEFHDVTEQPAGAPSGEAQPTPSTIPGTKEDVSRQDSAYRTMSTRSQPQAETSDQSKAIYDPSTDKGKAIVPSFQDAMSPDRRVELAEFLRRVLAKAHTNPEYKDALLYMIGLLKQVERTALGVKKRRVQDANALLAQQTLKQIIERFSQNYPLDGVIASLHIFADRLTSDFDLRNLLNDLRTFLQESLQDIDYVTHPDYKLRGAELIRRTRELLARNYAHDTERLARELEQFIEALKTDELTNAMSNDVQTLLHDLLQDDQGNYTIKTSLLGDLGTVFLPAILEQIKYIPIPRIEFEDKDWYIVIEDLVLESESFLPAVMEIKVKNNAIVGLRSTKFKNKLESAFGINMYKIQTALEDIPFYYRKKSGFPRLKDSGIADVTAGGQGINIATKFHLDMDSTERTLVADKIKVNVDRLRVRIHESMHDTLYSTLSPLINGLIRTRVTESLESQLHSCITTLDQTLTSLKLRFLERTEGEGRGPVNRLFDTLGLGRRRSGPALKRRGRSASLVPGEEEEEELMMLERERERELARRGVGRAPWVSEAFEVQGQAIPV